jgi:hypothetical protein
MYPALGSFFDGRRSRLMKVFAQLKLNKYWSCLEKAHVVSIMFGTNNQNIITVVGSCFVKSLDGKSEYGYEFRPPFEFHAWNYVIEEGKRPKVVDVALPGVIEKGLSTFDSVGPALIGRDPVLLAGVEEVPEWLRYRSVRPCAIDNTFRDKVLTVLEDL